MDHVLIQQRQKGSAAHTVVLDSEQPGSLRCELEILQEQQVSRRSTCLIESLLPQVSEGTLHAAFGGHNHLWVKRVEDAVATCRCASPGLLAAAGATLRLST